MRDYKGGARVAGVDWWDDEGHLQVAIYLLAVRELLGLDVTGGVYVPLAGRGRPRGVVSEAEAGALGPGVARGDLRSDADIDALLARTRARVADLVGRLRSGELPPCPERCGPDGCRYPAICREGAR